MTRRIERVNHLIRQQISELLRYQVKDPELDNFLTITEVITSNDLRHAKVFVSSVNANTDRKQALKHLDNASGFLRREMIKQLHLRHIPELDFRWDDSIERGAKIQDLIDRINQ